MYADICREQYKILVSEAFWFVVWVVLTSPVWAGFGCLQVSCVENKRGGMHLPKCNLKTHWLTSDDTLAFFPNLSAFICRYLFIEISRHVVWTCLELLIKLYTVTSTQERRSWPRSPLDVLDLPKYWLLSPKAILSSDGRWRVQRLSLQWYAGLLLQSG